MTSTIERAIASLSLAMSHISSVATTSSSAEDKEKLFLTLNLLRLQQGSLISYAECIRTKRRNARRNKKNNNRLLKDFIEKM